MKAVNRNKFVRGNIEEFSATKGYFVGRFMRDKGFPMLETEEVEVAWKKLPTVFEKKTAHYHKGGVEVNIVVSGSYKVWVGGEELELVKGDFLVVYPETKLKNLWLRREQN